MTQKNRRNAPFIDSRCQRPVKLLLIFIAEFINERRKESEGGSVFAVNPVFFIDDISRLYFLFFVTVF